MKGIPYFCLLLLTAFSFCCDHEDDSEGRLIISFGHHIKQEAEQFDEMIYTMTLSITFGPKGEKNISNIFPNILKSNMIWPYRPGGYQGSYHYMKLNGFWLNKEKQCTPFNFHLGIGQLYVFSHLTTSFPPWDVGSINNV